MDSAWAKFHHDLKNTGQSPYASTSNGTLKWSFSTGSSIDYSSPAIDSDGTIYIVADKVYAINPNGTLKLSYSINPTGTVSPAIGSDGTVYVGSWDYNFYALNPDGTIKWTYTTGLYVEGSPTIDADTIYFMSDDQYLYALNINGTLKWRYLASLSTTSPAIGSDHTIYVAGGDGNVYAVNPDGTSKWIFNTVSISIESSPAIGSDGTVYIGNDGVCCDYNGKLYAINPNGTKKWEYAVGTTIESSPAIGSDGTIYFGITSNPNGKLIALNPDGTLKWSYDFGLYDAIYKTSPAIDSNGVIYIADSNGNVSAINKNGTLKWNYTVPTHYYFESSPAIGSDGTIYAGSEDGSLYAFASQAPTPSGVTGIVTFLDVDNTTHPLPGAFVYINDTLNATTDSSGYYSIPNVPNGVYTLYASHSGFTTESKTISNAAPNNDFVLKFTQGFKFVQLTDVHIGPDPLCITEIDCSISFLDSIIKFNDVSDNIIKLSPAPNFVLITGDLVEWNSAFQYPVFDTFISKLKGNNITVYIVPGNHDRRGSDLPYPFNRFLPSDNMFLYTFFIGTDDYSNRTFDKNGYRFIGLDSGYDTCYWLNIPCDIDSVLHGPTGSGLSTDQMNFTKDNILSGKTIIFMHHPAIDDDNSHNVISENRDEFINLTSNTNVKLVLTGHTHYSEIFDKDGNSDGDCYDRSGTVSNGNIFSTCKILKNPLFVQTRSATKDDNTQHGYRNVDLGIDKNLKNTIKLTDVMITGVNSTPVYYFSLHSPADLHIFDEFGRHTGLSATGNIENNIPDSYYFEEYKLGNITLPAFALLYNNTLNYSIEIVSNFSRENITSDQSVFNFTIENRAENAITTINYNNVSINRNSIAYLQINTTQTNYTMQIDLNNDGIIDTTKQFDTIETDYAPTAIISSPADGSTWDQGQPVTFNGVGIDREDGTLNKLTWISDRDAVIGHGNFTTADLSAGVHNITLLVNDSVGQVNTTNIVITVRDTVPPLLNIEYPPENKVFNKQNVTVSGIAYDDSGILNVTVNGLEAGKENWNAIVTLNEGQNIINVTATDNNGFSTTANRTVYYNSSLVSDTDPPAAITNLTHKTGYDNVNRAWINWTWDNPKDSDFSYVMIYLDNIHMENTSRSYFNITGLSSNANYTITIQSADIVDNINLTEVKDTAKTSQTKTFPEAAIGFDTSIKDFKVYNETGIEANYVVVPSDKKSASKDSEKGWELRQYTLKGQANNVLVLVLKHKKEGKEAAVEIISMQYNGGAIMATPKNGIQAEYSDDGDLLKELEQKIEVQKLFDAEAKYSASKNKTEIKMNIEGQKQQKETRAGIVILELLTDNGGLKLRY